MKAQSRKALRKTIAVLALGLAGCLGTGLAVAAAPGNLDELLEQTRLARDTESKANAAREAKFLAERNRQSAMMAEVKAEVDEARKRSQQLSSTFDANEKRLTDMQAQLDSRAGNLGEMFGVVRQVANDFSSVVTNSIISAQYPGPCRIRRQAGGVEEPAVDGGPRALLVRAAARDDRDRQGREVQGEGRLAGRHAGRCDGHARRSVRGDRRWPLPRLPAEPAGDEHHGAPAGFEVRERRRRSRGHQVRLCRRVRRSHARHAAVDLLAASHAEGAHRARRSWWAT